MLKKCKKPDDMLFINASDFFEKGKKQNFLRPSDIAKIVATYRNRTEETRYSRRVPMAEVAQNGNNLNISRYVSTATSAEEIDLQAVHANLAEIEKTAAEATTRHNEFLAELGLPLI